MDGGYTGCSLSLTSRTIRVLSRSVRFHSVRLLVCHPNPSPTTTIERFLAAFTAERTRAVADESPAPRLHHLFLGTAPAPWDLFPTEVERCDWSPGSAEQQRRAVSALMDLVAADLHTLVLALVDLPSACAFPSALAATSFPALRELTIIDPTGHLPFAPFEPHPAATEDAPTYPRLVRLHMSGTLATMDLPRWAQRAPRLMHVFITDLRPFWVTGGATVEDLDAIFESGGDGRGEWLPVGASGPPGMRILIHCAQDRGTLPPSGGPRIWCS